VARSSSLHQQHERNDGSVKTHEEVKEENTAERQLATFRCNEFRKRPLMNKREFSVYCRLATLLMSVVWIQALVRKGLFHTAVLLPWYHI